MLAATTASLPAPLRRSPRPTSFSPSHGCEGGTHPLRPRPRRRTLACRAELQQDAPFVAAMGACVLASLALPPPRVRTDAVEEEEDGEFGATDTRMGVMGIISFLPYFNWLSWVFAYLDGGSKLYLVYAAVYLAPYLRTNLSLSPEESWLPIASIFICILHVQLEAAIRTGDIEGFKFVKKAQKLLFPNTLKENDGQRGKKRESLGTGHRGNTRIPSAHESREKLRNSDIFKRRLFLDKECILIIKYQLHPASATTQQPKAVTSSREDLMSPMMRNQRSQTGIESKRVAFSCIAGNGLGRTRKSCVGCMRS